MNLPGLKKYVLERMEKDLNPNLLYHAPYHTLDVFEMSEKIALEENVKEKDIILIQSAALLHDIGFVESFKDHENFSVNIANKVLPALGYALEDINIINNMILKTKLPQLPETFNEKVLCDADLDYLGREDFYIHAHKLRIEMAFLGKPTTLKEWYQIQYDFLSNHKYFTKSTARLREHTKQEYLHEIAEILQMSAKEMFSR